MSNKEKREKVAELMRQLVDETNTMGFDSEVAEGIYEGLVDNHRTLQQNFMRCFFAAMSKYAQSRSDFRNEASVKAAKKISELDIYFPFV